MILNSEDKKNLSEVRLEKAVEFLDDANANFEDKRYRTSVNRCYYASLSAIRALLILEGVNPESHTGATTMLSLRFIKTGRLPVDIVKHHKILLSRRTDVDYGDFTAVGREDAEDSLTRAQEIIDTISCLRKRLVSEL